MIAETYAVFAAWDFDRPKRENLDRLRDENFIGASSATWLRDVAKVAEPPLRSGRARPGARGTWRRAAAPSTSGSPLLLWHITRDEFLVRDFLQNWLFPAFEAGAFRVRPEELHDYLRGSREARRRRPSTRGPRHTLKRVAAGLLKMAVDFGLLRGSVVKEFATYHLPERSFLYLLHAMREEKQSPGKVVASPDWRMFLMRPADVERELLRLAPVPQARLPGRRQPRAALAALFASSLEYAERMVA